MCESLCYTDYFLKFFLAHLYLHGIIANVKNNNNMIVHTDLYVYKYVIYKHKFYFYFEAFFICCVLFLFLLRSYVSFNLGTSFTSSFPWGMYLGKSFRLALVHLTWHWEIEKIYPKLKIILKLLLFWSLNLSHSLF